MVGQARVLSVLIASPGDVPHHRAALAERIARWNLGSFSKELGVVLKVLRWEHNAVPMLGAGDAQQVINQQLVEDADVVVAVFHTRLGMPTERHRSGTAEEIAIGLARGIPVHVYVDTSPAPSSADHAQQALLVAYLAELRGQGLIVDVSGRDELMESFRLALEHDIVRVLKEPPQGAAGPASVTIADRLHLGLERVLTAEIFAPTPTSGTPVRIPPSATCADTTSCTSSPGTSSPPRWPS